MMSSAGGENREAMPLLPVSASQKRPVKITEDKEYWEDDFDEDKVLFSDGKRRGTSLIFNDAFILILEYLQYFGLIASLAARWPWPADWLAFSRYEVLINIDIWEFVKLGSNVTYKNAHAYFTPSVSMSLNYWTICLAWAIVFFILLASYIVLYVILMYKKHPFMLVRVAHLQRVYIVIMQLICLPIGLAAAKLFHTADKNAVDIDNTMEAYSSDHWVMLAPSLLLAVMMYILFPIWLIAKTQKEILSKSSERHEAYLQLKETEYVQGLDVLYIISSFHLFSSFKRVGAHYRAVSHMLKLVILVIYAALFQQISIQALLLTIAFSILTIAYMIIRPFRIGMFNFVLCFNFFCLTANCLVGTMQTNFDSYTLRSPWFTPTYLLYIHIVINGVWLFSSVVFVSILVINHFCTNKCQPLWPTMSSSGMSKLNPDTRRYMRAILRARHILEKSLQIPPIFAPAHELARQIQIINAFCREAEYLQDPIHDTLWDLLDELIDAHSRIAPKSLFAESVKDSIRFTAAELMKMMPMFVRRLAQREYDFILMNPMKRRMLLKMYCLGVFLNGRTDKIKKSKLNAENINRIWGKENDVDDGYYEDMYPAPIQGPNYRPVSALTLGMSEDERDDEAYFKDIEEWTADHPTSRAGSRGYANQAFDEDGMSALWKDSDSMNFSNIMEGVPSLTESRPGTKSSLRPKSRASLLSGGRPISAASNRSRQQSAVSMQRHVVTTDEQLVAGLQLEQDGSSGCRPATSRSASPQEDTPAHPQSGSTGSRPGSATYKRPGGASSATHADDLKNDLGSLETLVELPTPREEITG